MQDSTYETFLQNGDGSQDRVGMLDQPLDQSEPLEGPPCDVFLSQTNRDKARDNISGPTHWFLTEKLAIKTFLDKENDEPGITNDAMLFPAAHQCTCALVVLSPSFRRREFCVKELNTFMHRWEQDPNSIRVVPILWNLTDTTGYCPELGKLGWIISSAGEGAAKFLTQKLWPDLVRKVFGKQGYDKHFFEACLQEYIEKHINEGDLPTNLREYHQRKKEELAGSLRSEAGKDAENGTPGSIQETKASIRSNRKMMAVLVVGILLAIILVVVLSSFLFVKSNDSSNCSDKPPSDTISANGNNLVVGGGSTVTNNTFTQTNSGDVTAGYTCERIWLILICYSDVSTAASLDDFATMEIMRISASHKLGFPTHLLEEPK